MLQFDLTCTVIYNRLVDWTNKRPELSFSTQVTNTSFLTKLDEYIGHMEQFCFFVLFFKEDAAKKQFITFFSPVLNFGEFHKAEVLLEQLHKSRERADRANSKCSSDWARFEKRAAGESENYNILFQQKIQPWNK